VGGKDCVLPVLISGRCFTKRVLSVRAQTIVYFCPRPSFTKFYLSVKLFTRVPTLEKERSFN